MADDDRNMFYTVFRALGSLDAELKGKAGRDELQKLHGDTVRRDGEVEQRSRDLTAASVDGVRRDVRALEESLRQHGQDVRALHSDVSDMKTNLLAIRESVEAQTSKRVNWFDIATKVFTISLLLAMLIGTAIAILKGNYSGPTGLPKF